MKARAVLALVAISLVQGCSAGGGCTDVGGFSGISVEIPRSLFVTSGSVVLDVCDADGCAVATARLGPVPEGRVGRGANVSLDQLGRDFEPGQVMVTVTLSDSDGDAVASAERKIELTRYYPNGKPCDGDGYVVGSFALESGDRV